MPVKAKKKGVVMLAGALITHMADKKPIRLSRKNDPAYEVRGPIRMNGDEYPFHLFRHDEDPNGAKRDLIIAVDPYRKDNGKPFKGAKNRPVKACVHAYLVTPTADGEVITIDCHRADWIKSTVPDFEE